MKKKITLCMVLSTFIICAMLCLTNCSNDDAPTSVFTPEALKQTTWQAQMTVYNIEDEIDYTKQSILQFTNESEGIYTRTNEEDGYMWNTDFTYQVNGKIITFDNIAGPWTVMEYTGTHLVMEAYNPCLLYTSSTVFLYKSLSSALSDCCAILILKSIFIFGFVSFRIIPYYH